MNTLKTKKPTADNIRQMQTALNEIDCMVQSTQEKISAATASISLMLTQPDSPQLRKTIRNLCQMIKDCAWDAENYVNAEAENWGANYINPADRAAEEKMTAAARTTGEVSRG